jgi:5'-nucleotidase/UDP-sugar diphosphatase
MAERNMTRSNVLLRRIRVMFDTPRARVIATLAVLMVASLAVTLIFETRRGHQQPSIVAVTILQMNDVYEIMPLSGSDMGGLARVASLRQQLARENPNTYTLLAGDLLSPSALGGAKAGDDGKALNGRQMVDVMNLLGLSHATFGNHEFDLDEADFRQRLRESLFQWVSSNVLGAGGAAFPGVPSNVVITASNGSGRQARIGLFGLTINATRKDYVRYLDPIETARTQVEALKNTTDFIIALTHLSLEQDEALAEAVPELAMIVGGHEHLNVQARRGPRFVPIVKADANAKSVYVHRLRYDADTRHLDIDSHLQTITAGIASDPNVQRTVGLWRDKAFAAFRSEGIDPDKIVCTLKVTLDGREAGVRNGRTNLTDVIAQAMLDSFPGAEVAIFNSGSIRLDDTIPPGPMTQYDVLRVLPFPGTVSAARVQGSMLERILNVGRDPRHRNTGGYLQAAGIEAAGDGGRWSIRGKPLIASRDYEVVMNDYLLEGKEAGLEFVGQHGSSIVDLPDAAVEFRQAVIKRFETHGGS